MKKTLLLLSCIAFGYQNSSAQIDTALIRKMQQEANQNSQLQNLGLQLIDDIGPRLIGSPQLLQANDWIVKTYKDWGIEAHNEQYGTWPGWQRGETDVIMTSPRIEQLEGMQLAWCPSTPKGKYVEAEVIALPFLSDSISFAKWLPMAKGKIVLISKPEISGRPEASWKEYALEEEFNQFKKDRDQATKNWNENLKRLGTTYNKVQTQLEQAGAVALVSSYWTGGWSSNRIFGTKTKKIAHLDLKMEDYQMLYRFVERGKSPKLKLRTTSKTLGTNPVKNSNGMIKGVEKPDEYVMLSAHMDSWDGGTGATDNGTGTILMMEVMRILKKYYPNPKRTIIAGHWSGEEQGLNGSRSFAADDKEMMDKVSIAFNQDNGTGRISTINGLGFLDAYDYFSRWLAYLPRDSREAIKTDYPGNPGGRGGSDYASFLPYNVPCFNLSSNSWDYGMYTWHTTLDTYDKIVWEEIRRNAATIATLVYLACEEPEQFSRKKAELPMNADGKRMEWPTSVEPNRTGEGY